MLSCSKNPSRQGSRKRGGASNTRARDGGPKHDQGSSLKATDLAGLALSHLESLKRGVEERLSREQQRDVPPRPNPGPGPPPTPCTPPRDPASSSAAAAHRVTTSLEKEVEEAVYRHVSPEREQRELWAAPGGIPCRAWRRGQRGAGREYTCQPVSPQAYSKVAM